MNFRPGTEGFQRMHCGFSHETSDTTGDQTLCSGATPVSATANPRQHHPQLAHLAREGCHLHLNRRRRQPGAPCGGVCVAALPSLLRQSLRHCWRSTCRQRQRTPNSPCSALMRETKPSGTSQACWPRTATFADEGVQGKVKLCRTSSGTETCGTNRRGVRCTPATASTPCTTPNV